MEGYVRVFGKSGVVIVILGLGVINFVIGFVDVMIDLLFLVVFIG